MSQKRNSATFSFIPPTVTIQKTEKYSHMSNMLKRMLEGDFGKDFIILTTDGQEVPCHKSVLAAQSRYFQRMLYHKDTKEMQEGKLDLSGPDGFSKQAVDALLKFAYIQDIAPVKENFQVAVDLLHAAHIYEMDDLIDEIIQILEDRLNQTLGWFTVADLWRLYKFLLLWDDLNLVERKQKGLKIAVCALKRNLLQQVVEKKAHGIQQITDDQAVQNLLADILLEDVSNFKDFSALATEKAKLNFEFGTQPVKDDNQSNGETKSSTDISSTKTFSFTTQSKTFTFSPQLFTFSK